MSQHDWDKRFLELARVVSTWSKDPRTQVGAAVVNRHHRVVSVGFNGIPTGVDDKKPGRSDRPTKYHFYEHAERNAIFNAVGFTSLSGCIIYATHMPCCDCARGIIQTGIHHVVLPNNNPFFKGFIPQYASSVEMFHEAGVSVTLVGDRVNYRLNLYKTVDMW